MNKNKLPSIISVLILTLITVVMWISFEVYRAITKPASNVVSSEVSQSLIATLDQESLKSVETKLLLSDDQIPDIVINQGASPKATPIVPVFQTDEASNSASTTESANLVQ